MNLFWGYVQEKGLNEADLKKMLPQRKETGGKLITQKLTDKTQLSQIILIYQWFV